MAVEVEWMVDRLLTTLSIEIQRRRFLAWLRTLLVVKGWNAALASYRYSMMRAKGMVSGRRSWSQFTPDEEVQLSEPCSGLGGNRLWTATMLEFSSG